MTDSRKISVAIFGVFAKLAVFICFCLSNIAYAQSTWYRLGPNGMSGPNGFAQDQSATVYLSTLYGVFASVNGVWAPANEGLRELATYSVIADDYHGVFVSGFRGVYRRSDLTQQWEIVGNELIQGRKLLGFANSGSLFIGNPSVGTRPAQLNVLARGATNWMPVTLDGVDPLRVDDFALARSGDLYTAVGNDGVYRLVSGGNRWERFNDGISGVPRQVLVGPSGNAYAVVQGNGIYRLLPGGTRWDVLPVEGLTSLMFESLAEDFEGNLLAISYIGSPPREWVAFKLVHNAAQWTNLQLPLGTGDSARFVFGSREGDVYTTYFTRTLSTTGIFKLPASGVWQRNDDGLTGRLILGLAVDAAGSLYTSIFTARGVLRLTPDFNWEEVNNGLPGLLPVSRLTTDSYGNVFGAAASGLSNQQIYKLDAPTNTWNPAGTGLPFGSGSDQVQLLTADSEGNLYATTNSQALIYRLNAGSTVWQPFNPGLPSTIGVRALAARNCGSVVYVSIFGSTQGGVYARKGFGPWIEMNEGLLPARDAGALFCDGTYVYAATGNGRLFRMPFGSPPWQEISEGLSGSPISAFAGEPNGELYVAGNGVFKFDRVRQRWQALPSPSDPSVTHLLLVNGLLFAGTQNNSLQVYVEP